MGARIAAVLFDAVGTLIATRRPIGVTYAEVAGAHGLPLDPTRVEDAFRRVFPRMPPMAFPDAAPVTRPVLERGWWEELVRRTLRDAAPVCRVEHFDVLFAELFSVFASAEVWRLRPGARECLATLTGAGRRVALLSNFDHRLHTVLRELELADAFEFVLLPGDAGAAKPDPRIFALALERLKLAGHEVALVGDDPRDDLEGARRAGIHGVDVRELATLDELEPALTHLESRLEEQGEE